MPSVTARPSLCAVPAQPDTGTGATAFPQDFKELCCVNACSYLYNYREVIDCRGRFSNSDVTHVEDPDVVGTSSCVLFPTFLSRGAHDV